MWSRHALWYAFGLQLNPEMPALDAGKHVLCEKPLAATAEDVDRVQAVARARQRVVAEAFMYRHEPMTSRILELLSAQAIGRISHIAAGFTFVALSARFTDA